MYKGIGEKEFYNNNKVAIRKRVCDKELWLV